MELNLKAQCDFVFNNFYCVLLEDMMDVEVTIWTVDGIHTYRRERMTTTASYSPWSRQVSPFSSLRKKIDNYEEEKKENCEKRRSFNPFTPVRENNFGKKRSRRSQKSRKYRKLDMGHIGPSTVVCTWPTNTTTTVNLSVPTKLPSTLNVPTVPKPQSSSQTSKWWPRPYTAVPLLSPVHSGWSSEEDWDGNKQKEREARQNHQRTTEKKSRGEKKEKGERECPTVFT